MLLEEKESNAKFEIYRGIALDDGEKINTHNIGVSQSICDLYTNKHVDSIIRARGKDGYIILHK